MKSFTSQLEWFYLEGVQKWATNAQVSVGKRTDSVAVSDVNVKVFTQDLGLLFYLKKIIIMSFWLNVSFTFF